MRVINYYASSDGNRGRILRSNLTLSLMLETVEVVFSERGVRGLVYFLEIMILMIIIIIDGDNNDNDINDNNGSN